MYITRFQSSSVSTCAYQTMSLNYAYSSFLNLSTCLKDCEQSVYGGVEVGGWRSVLEVELAPEELHPQQGKDEYEQEEKQEEGHDGR